MAYVYQRDRSLRHQLQGMLGDLGEILEHQQRGTVDRPARGWYAVLQDTGEVVFLGDHSLVAAVKIRELHES